MISHHPSDEALAQMAAGALPAGPRLVIATHLSSCPHCRARLHAFEAVGGALLADEAPSTLRPDAFARTLAMLDRPEPAQPARRATPHPELPAPLCNYEIGPWRFVQPYLRWRRLVLPEDPQANIIMLKVAAGRPLPHHTHTGREFTQVISGGFSDSLGHYVVGDCVEADEDIDHQPVVDADGECIVLASVEGRLRLHGWLGRLFQPLIGI
jgi:putative transcriptional regulator